MQLRAATTVRRVLREEADSERLSPRLAAALLALPVAATVALALTALHSPLFRALVAEDGPLEWSEPAPLERVNVQEELTLHNVAGVDHAFRVVLLLLGAYGSCAWLFLRDRARSPGLALLVPPAFLASLFLVAAAYFAARLALFPSPGYALAKFSEMPELFVVAGVLAVLLLDLRRRRFARVTSRTRGHPLPDAR